MKIGDMGCQGTNILINILLPKMNGESCEINTPKYMILYLINYYSVPVKFQTFNIQNKQLSTSKYAECINVDLLRKYKYTKQYS